jgi:multidrug efflux system membrane fusion protein
MGFQNDYDYEHEDEEEKNVMERLGEMNRSMHRHVCSSRSLLRNGCLLAVAVLTFAAAVGCGDSKAEPRGAPAERRTASGGDRGGGAKNGGEAAKVSPVLVAKATRHSVPVSLRAVGTVEAFSTVEVRSQVGGELVGVHFVEGQDVKAGDLLFTIDPRPFDIQIGKDKATLAKDTAQKEKALLDIRRYDDLLKSKAVSPQEYESARAQAEVQTAQVEADRAQVEDSKLQREFCLIRSPIDGRTGALQIHAGNLIKANDSSSLVTINRVNPVYVSFSVPDRELPRVRAAMAGPKPPEVRAALPDTNQALSTGTLSFLDNQVNRSTGTILLKATFPNAGRHLWPGQYVDVTLDLSVLSDAILVPSQAVQMGQNGQFVYVVKGSETAEVRSVKTGISTDAGETVIEKGLAPGETVVTEGQLRLAPGARIEIKADGSQSKDGES